MLSLVGLAVSMGGDQPTNVVMVLADDQGWGDVGYNSGSQYQDPSYKVRKRDGILLVRKMHYECTTQAHCVQRKRVNSRSTQGA